MSATTKTSHFSFQRSGRITDLSLPSDLVNHEDAALYEGLREAERELDWTMARKVMEVHDSLSKNIQKRQTLRVYVTHVPHNQIWQTKEGETPVVDFESGKGIPSWELRIEGKLLQSAPREGEASTSSLPPPPPRKFSSFLKSLIIETDRDTRIYPEEAVVEWHRNTSLPAEEGFILRRRGDVSVRVRILLHVDHTPERCNISPPLSEVLGVRQASRTEIITALYQYIKLHGLQDKVDRRLVKTDDALRRAGVPDQFVFQDVPTLIHRFLLPPEPVVIFHTVNLDPNATNQTVAYDVIVDTDDVDRKAKMRDVMTRINPAVDSKVTRLDQEISEAVQNLRSAHLKRQFFESFSDNPQQFLSDWLTSQSRDLETILGTDRGVPDELMRRADFFRLPWVEEAVAVHEGMRLAGVLPSYNTAPQAR